MLARLEDYGLTQNSPFHGGLVTHSYPQGLDTDMHQAFEVGIVLTGRMERHYEATVLTLGPWEVWLCASWEPHGWRPLAPGTMDLVLQFLPDFLGEEMFGRHSWLGLFAAPPEQRPRVASEETRQQVMLITGQLRREMERREPGWPAAIRLWILQLLLAISREWEPPAAALRAQTAQASGLAKLMPAVRLVQSNPSHRVRLEEAAAVCGLGVSQFTHSFRRLMGLSFRSFCTRARLAAAAEMLLTTDQSVEDIAQHLAFADASHLHHGFAAAYGCTPAQYRVRGRAQGDAVRYTVRGREQLCSGPRSLTCRRSALAPAPPVVYASAGQVRPMGRRIIVSDLHVDTWDDQRYGPEGRGKTKLEHWRDLLDWCEQVGIDELVVNGDIMSAPPYGKQETFASPIVREAAARLISYAARRDLTYIFGNHDMGISGVRCARGGCVPGLEHVALAYPGYRIELPQSILLLEHGHEYDPLLRLYLGHLTSRDHAESRLQSFLWAQQRRHPRTGERLQPPGVGRPSRLKLRDNLQQAVLDADRAGGPIGRVRDWVKSRLSHAAEYTLWRRAAREVCEVYLRQEKPSRPTLYCLMGHTHVPDFYRFRVGRLPCIYLNSGSWVGSGESEEDRKHATYLDVDERGEVHLQDWIWDRAA